MEIVTGNSYLLSSGNEIHTKSVNAHKEKAMEFQRYALTKDIRTALTKITYIKLNKY